MFYINFKFNNKLKFVTFTFSFINIHRGLIKDGVTQCRSKKNSFAS